MKTSKHEKKTIKTSKLATAKHGKLVNIKKTRYNVGTE